MSKVNLDPKLTKQPLNANVIEDFDCMEHNEVETEAQPKKPTRNFNPLSKYFRAPGISIRLPSNNFYYKNNEVETNLNGEVDIFPMTGNDELLLKNPDALISGRAVELIIQSCVPQIRNVRSLVSCDIDVLLLAIRAVTFDFEMPFAIKCPKCTHENSYNADLRNIINKVEPINPPYFLNVEDSLLIFYKPYTFEDQTKASLAAYEQIKKIQYFKSLPEEELQNNPQVKEQLNAAVLEVSSVKNKLLSNAITHCVVNYDKKTNTGEIVEDKKFIEEFLNNAPRKIISNLNDNIADLQSTSLKNARNVSLQCEVESCKHIWYTDLEFNPSDFFG